MAPLPRPFSEASHAIETAISEGRADDAMDKLVAALKSGKHDKAVMFVAARWIEAVGLKPSDAKALRAGRNALPREWMEIADYVQREQDDNRKTYANAIESAERYFGYSRRHVEKCVAMWRRGAADTCELE